MAFVGRSRSQQIEHFTKSLKAGSDMVAWCFPRLSSKPLHSLS